MSQNIQLKVENFRAIDRANISIDGITLVAGENGSGKSTVSKLLYFLFKTISNYDYVVKEKLYSNLQDILRFLKIFYQEIIFSFSDKQLRSEFRKEIDELRRNLFHASSLEEEHKKWIALIDKVEYLYTNYKNKEEKFAQTRVNRMNRIIKEILKENLNTENIEDAFNEMRKLISDRFKEAKGKIESRPSSIFIEELHKIFNDSKLPKVFEVSEYNDVIVSLQKNNLSIPFSVEKAIYIDTPMALSVYESTNEYWDDLNQLLLDDKNQTKNEITNLISGNIIRGDVENDDNIFLTDEFKFRREDGAIFNLLEMATGIKSFSILQLLLKNGHLNEKTLLIIDEPESNLHPQWIIEYARIIVLLNKRMGVKFFLASHNPDMVSAIRYISEKEDILENVNFYLATKSKNNFQYDYKPLGKEIDPIFESFNIAIDRINQYGI